MDGHDQDREAQRASGLIPLVDAHHHLWDLDAGPRYPWLQGAPVDTHFGDYQPIRKSYLPRDFSADAAGQAVIKTVHCEAGWDPHDPVAETRWVQQVADRCGFPNAIVAHVELQDERIRCMLEQHRCSPNLRGVRQLILTGRQLRRRELPEHLLLEDPRWLRGYRLLEEFGLSFDLQAPPQLMEIAARIARANPGIIMVVTHCGLPLDRTEAGVEHWKRGMRLLATCPNVAVKISGLPMTDWHWTTESLYPFVMWTVDAFGPARCMIGSNFPVDRLFSSYARLMGAYREILSSLSQAEQVLTLNATAQRIYRI